MLEGHKQFKMALFLGLFSMATVSAYAQNPEITMNDPMLLKGSATVRVEQSRGANEGNMSPLFPQHRMEIDSEIRTLGGTHDLSNAPRKQLPAQKFPFFLNPDGIQDNLQLTIGYIRGINTPEAHEAGQSNAGFVSSPAVIKVNGVRIEYIYTDGDLIQIKIPKAVLHPEGFNVIQVEAGFYFMPGNRVAYDELQLQHLAISY